MAEVDPDDAGNRGAVLPPGNPRGQKTLMLGGVASEALRADPVDDTQMEWQTPVGPADDPLRPSPQPPSIDRTSIDRTSIDRTSLTRTSQALRASLSGQRKSTTLIELAAVADDVATAGEAQKIWLHLIGSTLTAVGLACAVLLPLPTWAKGIILLVPASFIVTATMVWVLGRAGRWVATRPSLAERALPGGLHHYVACLGLVGLGGSVLASWGTVEATERVAGRFATPKVELRSAAAPVVRPRRAKRHADRNLEKGKPAERLSPGVLYVPTTFSSPDGRFDVIIHFHGYPPLVQDSVEAAGLNAVVLSVNLGIGGAPYRARMAHRDAFDLIVDRIEGRMKKKGLNDADVGRVAVSAWSAGYGALYQLLSDPDRDRRIDAVFALDTPHGSFVGGSREIQPESVAPYLPYAKKAIAGERLFVITHSAITTDDYASTTETTDFMLSALDLQRSPGGEPVETPDFETAIGAFPGGNRRWLEPTSHCEEGLFRVLAYEGRTPENHIAHLAQMSNTVLVLLRRRWR